MQLTQQPRQVETKAVYGGAGIRNSESAMRKSGSPVSRLMFLEIFEKLIGPLERLT